MFIPVGTDAPIYHFPFATIALAVVNIAAHVGFGMADPDGEMALSALKQDWSLWFGEGVHPLQWVTSCFLHAGWVHLIGNLIFLWGFGIIVEGKLGWWRFTLLYVAVGAIACGVEQLIMLPTDLVPTRDEVVEMLREEDPTLTDEQVADILGDVGELLPDHSVALGASGAIFGMVAIAMIWAPRNDLDVLWIIWIRGGISEVPILVFAMLYIGLEAVTLGLTVSVFGVEQAMSSAFLHVVGALVGAGAGVLLLKRGWVDCENWDLFAVLRGTHGDRSQFELHRKYTAELTVPSMAAGGGGGTVDVVPDDDEARRPAKSAKRRRKADPLAKLRRHLDAGDGISAAGEIELLRVARPGFLPPEPDAFRLCELVDRDGDPAEVAELLADYLNTYGPAAESHDAAHANVVRLRAARRLLAGPGRRSQAAGLLKGVDPLVLTAKQRGVLEKLAAKAAGA